MFVATWISAVAVLSFVAMTRPAVAQQIRYSAYPEPKANVQPLQWQELPSWMTLSMQLRGRTEGQTSYNYLEGNERIYELTRVWGNVEVRPTSFATGFLQFIDTHALGLPLPSVASNMRDVFDLRQGYLDLHGQAGKVPIHAITGRQELKFGSERIVGISDWTNNSRTWDGFVLRLGDQNRIDLFSTSVVAVHPSSLDKHGAGLTFHGAYASLGTWVPKVHVSPFVLVRTVRGVTSQQGLKGNEVETTFGVEVEGKLPANFDYLVNADLQRGSYANDSIHSGESFGKFDYSPPRLPWKPRLGGEYDYATGNAHRNPYRISTYDQQYPSNHNAFGLTDLFGFENIRQERLNLDLGPTKNSSILIQGEFLNLVDRHDNLYNSAAGTILKAPTAGFSTDQIGTGFDASAKYLFHNFLLAQVGVGHFFPGALMLSNNHGSAQTLGYFSLTYNYRVDKQAKPFH